MEVLEGRCDKICDLLKRETERQLELKKKQDDKNLSAAENEKIEYFDNEFNKKRAGIENDLNGLNNLETKELPEQFDSISKKILQLQKFVASSNIFLRVYDIKRYQEILNELNSKCNRLEEQLLPKKKFSFKNRNKNTVKLPVPSDQKNVVDEVDSSSLSKCYIPVKNCGFENISNQNLKMDRETVSKNDVRLQNLSKCTIKIFGNPSTLHMSKMVECIVLSGPVSTSIFANNCRNCTFVVACQQLRLHSSQSVQIYLHVTSRAIIEDCKDISFAPYNLKYNNIEQDFEDSGLNKEKNNWTAIDDFNWLNVDKPSPNWRVLDEKHMQKNWSTQ
ncbi:tubulin-specific chaperone C isoform X1 [Agrilus planipennis]|uniref:Tubulin-specific chaperone C isoform X1 n=1 Tax=Agrilus planipennis TaxID=224129 RepID=A0A1W4X219_AGRPL|nr:tubulin-specific chaperone C isoform X1 [Agrilus planipennis]XP_025834731.1 tubulin-specific chaperone C isoform X1 [Agrilus planipennis]